MVPEICFGLAGASEATIEILWPGQEAPDVADPDKVPMADPAMVRPQHNKMIGG